MYKVLLISKYLRRKLAPLFAAAAVALCTAMVLIVISVMGGFLDMMRQAARTLSGEILIQGGIAGFPRYEELIAELRRELPTIQAATAVIRTFGLVKIRGVVRTVEVHGIDPRAFHEVMLHENPRQKSMTGFRETLYWTTPALLDFLDATTPKEELTPAVREVIQTRRRLYVENDLVELGMTMRVPPFWAQERAVSGIVPGIEVSPYNARDEAGRYSIAASSLGSPATLTVLPVTQAGSILEPAVRAVVVVNEFKSGLYQVDANRVYVPLALLQTMLKMDAFEAVDPQSGEKTGATLPAMTTEVMLRAAAGQDLNALADRVRTVVQRFRENNADVPVLEVLTWEQEHATLLGAVQKEKLMVTFLFAIISVVAVVMIGVIFYMIVLEKTRDIGTLRALGASRGGVASIFLGYGLTIGVIGAVLGLGLATLVVRNINEIQGLLARTVGFQMWNPRIYYFDRIPSQLDPTEVAWIAAAAVLSSVVGSVIPALLAARLNPVEALRYE